MPMGRIWRTYKSELSRKITPAAKSKDINDHLAALKELKPKYMKSEQHRDKFFKHRISIEFHVSMMFSSSAEQFLFNRSFMDYFF